MDKIKISGVVITFNEEINIERCLQSLIQVCDEIIIVDSYSTDTTTEIAKKYQAKVIQQKFLGYTVQKNFAIDQSSFDYVLSLDADEALSQELINSILNVKLTWQFDGYEMNRLTNYCGEWVRHCGWYPDRKIRLFDKRKARWVGGALHEKMTMNPGASCSRVKGDLLHYSYYNIDDHLKQVEKFTKISSQELFDKGYCPSNFKIAISAPVKFFRDYFLKLGFLDGYTGFRISLISSFATFLKYARVRELHNLHKNN